MQIGKKKNGKQGTGQKQKGSEVVGLFRHAKKQRNVGIEVRE